MNSQHDLFWKLTNAALPTMKSDSTWYSDYKSLLQTPVNPNASQAAKDLLALLYQVTGTQIITGQHEYLEDPNGKCNQVYAKTGVYPMLKGIELGAMGNQTETLVASQRANAASAAIAWAQAGGITAVSYHARKPLTAYDWGNINTGITQAEFDTYITPGTAQYNGLIADLDLIAVPLKQLRDAGVATLFRPWHEMNGGWFWWGAKTNFIELWKLTYDRLVNYHGLNNLIWVWCPNANNASANAAKDYFVGHEFVDALAMDIYSADFNPAYYAELKRLSEGKPIGIGENGELPSMTTCRLKQWNYAWFMTWGSYLTSNNSDATIQAVYADPYALTRGETPNPVQTYPADTTVGNGLTGAYYTGANFNTLYTTKTISPINFNWTTATTVGNWNMSVRWSGYVRAEYDETYTFYVQSSDGVRLYVDGETIIDDWTVHGTSEVSGTYTLKAGKYYFIKLEYFNGGDTTANVKLSWSSPSLAKEVIPTAKLFTY